MHARKDCVMFDWQKCFPCSMCLPPVLTYIRNDWQVPFKLYIFFLVASRNVTTTKGQQSTIFCVVIRAVLIPGCDSTGTEEICCSRTVRNGQAKTRQSTARAEQS